MFRNHLHILTFSSAPLRYIGHVFYKNGGVKMKKSYFAVLSTAFLAAGLLAAPATGLAQPQTAAKTILQDRIESIKHLNYEGKEIKIVRDSFGVPHVYSDNDSSLFFGAGYAMAEDRLWQAELSRVVASGKMAEFAGPGANNSNILQDEVIRRDGYTNEETLKQFDGLPDYVKRGLLGYIAGINYYIETTPASKLPPEFRGVKPAKWTVLDSLKIQQLMVRRFGESGGGELTTLSQLTALQQKYGIQKGYQVFETVHWKNDPTAPVSLYSKPSKDVTKAADIPDAAKFPKGDQVGKQLEHEQQMKIDIENSFGFPHKGGSNAWIVSPSKSTSGGTLLLGGPQMGYTAPQIAHEIGIHGAGYNSEGMAFAGAGPIPLIGRGQDYSWTTTTGMGDQIDTFVLKINPANPNQYWYKGKWKNFEVRTETIHVAGGATIDYPVNRSVYGPVIYKDNTTAYTQERSHWGQEVQAMTGFYDFNRARNIKQFEKAVSEIPTSHNFLYTDKQGNIGYWISGRNPIRAAGTDNRLPMIGDGSQDWQGIEPFSTMPHAMNPAQGVVASWNNKPSADWDYTETVYGPTHRVKFIQDQLKALKKISFSDMEAINKKAGITELNAYFFKNLLLAKLDNGEQLPESLKQARDLVSSWDNTQTDANGDNLYDNPGLTIFRSWFNLMKSNVLQALQGTGTDSNDVLYHVLTASNDELRTKYDFLGNLDLHKAAVDSLQTAIQNLSTQYAGKDMIQWLTTTDKINFQPLGAGKVDPILYINRGTYNQIVEFDKNSSKSVNILPPGQSGNPFSPHFDDQRLLYSSWQYKPMVLDILKPSSEEEQK